MRSFRQATKILFLLLAGVLGAVAIANAEFTIDGTAPTPSTLTAADDFATEVIGQPWDMSSRSSIANYVEASDTYGITSPTFSNGILSTTLQLSGGYIKLLATPFCSANPSGITGATHPIATSRYRYLNIRMHSSVASQMRIAVTTSCNWFQNYWTTVAIPTYAGWFTYTIDLQTIGHETNSAFFNGANAAWNSAPATGLRINPAVQPGTQIKLDWVTLTANQPTDTFPLNYTYNQEDQKFYSIYVDDDNNALNGFKKSLVVAEGATQSVDVGSSGLYSGSYKVVGYESNDWPTLVGNPWDMSDSGDLYNIDGLNASFASGQYSGSTTKTNGYFFLNFNNRTSDLTQFRHFRAQLTLSGVSGSPKMSIYGRNANGDLINGVPLQSSVLTNGTQSVDIDLSSLGSSVGSLQVVLISQQNVNFDLDYISLRNDAFGVLPSPTMVASTWNFRVNTPPILKILQPDNLGGADYAAEVLGNPWNFEDTEDIFVYYNVTDAQILPNNYVSGVQGNFFTARSILNNFDPHEYSINTQDPLRMIDTNRYKNVVYRLLTAAAQDIVLGSVVRIVWHVNGRVATDFFNGDDQITFDDWNVYSQNMRDIDLEELQHSPGSYPAQPWYGKIDAFRVDAHEFSTPTTYYFDYIKVTADDEANTQFAVTFDLDDVDGDDATAEFYWNTSNTTSGGTLIGTRKISNNSSVVFWNTTGRPNGTYYIYAKVFDDYNDIFVKATGPIVVDHSRAQDSSLPILQFDAPISGATIYDNFIVRGYALDNVQVASVEVFVDGKLLKRFNPTLFDSRAQNAYKSFSESGNAGFFENVDASSITTGSKNLQIKVYDTAGNLRSSSVIPVIKSPGADPDLDTPPPPFNAAPINVTNPIFNLPALGLKSKLDLKKQTLTLTVSGGEACSNINFTWNKTAKEIGSAPLALKSFPGSGSATQKFTAKKLNPLTRQKLQQFFIRANCDGARLSPIVKFNITRIPERSSVAKHAGWAKQLKKRLKKG